MSANTTKAFNQGRCAAPFREEALFGYEGGFIDGRFCSDLAGFSCCLTCPSTEWLYPEGFKTMTRATNWVNVVGIVCAVFLLLSWAFLPPSKTHRHYLSVCLTIATVLMSMGFIIPLAARPEQCYDDITPNSMQTSATCATSGAFLIAGGWAAVVWVFMRALALHLQICWQVVIGKTFMWGALTAGWGIPAIGLTIAMILSGVSFRFGDTCHINHKNSLADLWIPLLACAAITLIIQFATFGYCIKVYLASLRDDSNTTNSSGLPYSTSMRGTITPRQAYRRVRKVIELQWRGIAVVLLIIADVIFFAVIFVYMDDTETNMMAHPDKAQKWIGCLIRSQGHKNECLQFASDLVINQATVMAVLVLLSMNGIWCLILLGRWSMFTGWYELVRGKVKPSTEFVSVDVRTFKDPGTYEMLSRDRDNINTKNEPMTFSQPITPLSPAAQQTKSGRETPDYFGREARYKSPTRSFSSPKPPHASMASWDSSASHAQAKPYYTGMDPLSMNKI